MEKRLVEGIVVQESGAGRVATGITQLDRALSGGFPRSSAILITGLPGTGKTIFCMTLLWNGITKMGEKGMYVSLVEEKEVMYENMRQLGMDFQKMEDEERFVFHQIRASTEDTIGEDLSRLFELVTQRGIKRIVVDSITAIGQALESRDSGRQILQTGVKMLRSLGCTTLVVSERAYEIQGSDYSGFVADGIISFEAKIPRELSVQKMRGTPILCKDFLFTIDDQFSIIDSKMARPTSAKRWKPIITTGDFISTGSEDLDAVLGGGFRRGTYAVIVAAPDVTAAEISLLTHATVRNFLSQGLVVLYRPQGGVDAREILSDLQPYLQKNALDGLRVAEEGKPDEPRRGMSSRYSVRLKTGRNSIDTNVRILFNALSELKRSTGDKPALRVMCYDAMENKYAAVLEKFYNEVGSAIMRTRTSGDITLGVIRSRHGGFPESEGHGGLYL